ncbi:unnamed protein product [Amoebophrya sp. A25]|nr:unnamed protein product [Amoebophrya sp. A25]|eukprot:GSA25T00017606001.1
MVLFKDMLPGTRVFVDYFGAIKKANTLMEDVSSYDRDSSSINAAEKVRSVGPTAQAAIACSKTKDSKKAPPALTRTQLEALAPVHFLSHFHSDHYLGMEKNWESPMVEFRDVVKIYSTPVSARLLEMLFQIRRGIVQAREVHRPFFDLPAKRYVCCLVDANHCPGSSIVLIQVLKTGRRYMNTGDFRFYESVGDRINEMWEQMERLAAAETKAPERPLTTDVERAVGAAAGATERKPMEGGVIEGIGSEKACVGSAAGTTSTTLKKVEICFMDFSWADESFDLLPDKPTSIARYVALVEKLYVEHQSATEPTLSMKIFLHSYGLGDEELLLAAFAKFPNEKFVFVDDQRFLELRACGFLQDRSAAREQCVLYSKGLPSLPNLRFFVVKSGPQRKMVMRDVEDRVRNDAAKATHPVSLSRAYSRVGGRSAPASRTNNAASSVRMNGVGGTKAVEEVELQDKFVEISCTTMWWCYNKHLLLQQGAGADVCPVIRDEQGIYRVLWAMHSPLRELRQFVALVRPRFLKPVCAVIQAGHYEVTEVDKHKANQCFAGLFGNSIIVSDNGESCDDLDASCLAAILDGANPNIEPVAKGKNASAREGGEGEPAVGDSRDLDVVALPGGQKRLSNQAAEDKAAPKTPGPSAATKKAAVDGDDANTPQKASGNKEDAKTSMASSGEVARKKRRKVLRATNKNVVQVHDAFLEDLAGVDFSPLAERQHANDVFHRGGKNTFAALSRKRTTPMRRKSTKSSEKKSAKDSPGVRKRAKTDKTSTSHADDTDKVKAGEADVGEKSAQPRHGKIDPALAPVGPVKNAASIADLRARADAQGTTKRGRTLFTNFFKEQRNYAAPQELAVAGVDGAGVPNAAGNRSSFSSSSSSSAANNASRFHNGNRYNPNLQGDQNLVIDAAANRTALAVVNETYYKRRKFKYASDVPLSIAEARASEYKAKLRGQGFTDAEIECKMTVAIGVDDLQSTTTITQKKISSTKAKDTSTHVGANLNTSSLDTDKSDLLIMRTNGRISSDNSPPEGLLSGGGDVSADSLSKNMLLQIAEDARQAFASSFPNIGKQDEAGALEVRKVVLVDNRKAIVSHDRKVKGRRNSADALGTRGVAVDAGPRKVDPHKDEVELCPASLEDVRPAAERLKPEMQLGGKQATAGDSGVLETKSGEQDDDDDIMIITTSQERTRLLTETLEDDSLSKDGVRKPGLREHDTAADVNQRHDIADSGKRNRAMAIDDEKTYAVQRKLDSEDRNAVAAATSLNKCRGPPAPIDLSTGNKLQVAKTRGADSLPEPFVEPEEPSKEDKKRDEPRMKDEAVAAPIKDSDCVVLPTEPPTASTEHKRSLVTTTHQANRKLPFLAADGAALSSMKDSKAVRRLENKRAGEGGGEKTKKQENRLSESTSPATRFPPEHQVPERQISRSLDKTKTTVMRAGVSTAAAPSSSTNAIARTLFEQGEKTSGTRLSVPIPRGINTTGESGQKEGDSPPSVQMCPDTDSQDASGRSRASSTFSAVSPGNLLFGPPSEISESQQHLSQRGTEKITSHYAAGRTFSNTEVNHHVDHLVDNPHSLKTKLNDARSDEVETGTTRRRMANDYENGTRFNASSSNTGFDPKKFLQQNTTPETTTIEDKSRSTSFLTIPRHNAQSSAPVNRLPGYIAK